MIELPSFKDNKQTEFWLKGKASRNELLNLQSEIMKLQQVINNQNNLINKVFSFVSLNGLQNETLVRMLDMSVSGFRENFIVQLDKTSNFVSFLSSINVMEKDKQKTMKEKIELVRNWNSNENNLTVKEYHFGLSEYLKTKANEFTEEELVKLKLEFGIEEPKASESIIVTPEEVKNDRNQNVIITG